jgi:haloacetate dehalogenase
MADVRFDRLEHTVGEASYPVLVGGDGPPVLFLHGFPETHVCWDPRRPGARGAAHGGTDGPAGLRREHRTARRTTGRGLYEA